MLVQEILPVLSFLALATSAERIEVKLSACSTMVNIDTQQSMQLVYLGAAIRSCQYLVYTEQSQRDLCVKPSRTDLGCSIKLEYAGGTYYPGSPDKEFSCSSPPEEWCTSRGMLYITFSRNGTDAKSDVQLDISSVEGSGDSKSDKAVIMGVVIGCSVFVLACLAIVGYCCFIRRCSHKLHRARHKPKAVPTNDFRMSSTK